MIDVGAHVGLMSLYVADRVTEVGAFEMSPTNFDLLSRNVMANAGLRERIRLFNHGLGDWPRQEATALLRDARTALREIGLTSRSLLKIDIGGAEYLVVPALADMLAGIRPHLHLSFHPFNLVAGDDEYLNAVVRIRRAMQMAEALAPYRYMYCHSQGTWYRIEQADRMVFLREYLLRRKPLARIGNPQYGFVDAIGFTDQRLTALDEATPPAGG
jgi:hypothetical protein